MRDGGRVTRASDATDGREGESPITRWAPPTPMGCSSRLHAANDGKSRFFFVPPGSPYIIDDSCRNECTSESHNCVHTYHTFTPQVALHEHDAQARRSRHRRRRLARGALISSPVSQSKTQVCNILAASSSSRAPAGPAAHRVLTGSISRTARIS